MEFTFKSHYGINGTQFFSPDRSGAVQVAVTNGTGMSFENMSMYFSHHPIGGGRLLEFDSNNYFLSGHPAFRSIELRAIVPHNVKTMTFATALGGKMYFVIYIVLQERFADYLQTAQTMIDSFQIINKQ